MALFNAHKHLASNYLHIDILLHQKMSKWCCRKHKIHTKIQKTKFKFSEYKSKSTFFNLLPMFLALV